MRSGRTPTDTHPRRSRDRHRDGSNDVEPNADANVVQAIQHHLPGLERYVRSLTRDPDEAADVCQEACVRLLVVTRQSGLPDRPGAWMARVAHNLVISRARRRHTAERHAGLVVEAASVPPVDEQVVERERDEELRDVLRAARSDDRTAMTMAADGFAMREIAQHLGRTELATRALLCRARGRMRVALVTGEALAS
jgi:RNA polymerase sigma-70 factor (ECF subfamily)